jgi:hypothetical protein
MSSSSTEIPRRPNGSRTAFDLAQQLDGLEFERDRLGIDPAGRDQVVDHPRQLDCLGHDQADELSGEWRQRCSLVL